MIPVGASAYSPVLSIPEVSVISLVLVSHGQLAGDFLRVAEMITGRQEAVISLGLAEGESPTVFRKRLREAILSLPTYDGTLVLTDMWGGTPCNVALSLTRECSLGVDCAVVSGLNLAMLLDALAQREKMTTARDLAERATRAGSEDIRSEG